MKVLYIILYVLLLFTSCSSSPNCDTKDVTIKMQKINGEWITRTYNLHECAAIYIDTYRGSYSLNWEYVSDWGHLHRGVIRNGVIDYRIVKRY